ncbi:MAG: YidC/Oxa1 family membrane protein insertase [Tissierellia bacterium]|nr:YidC/Oxa1 family membrane protein insertase [Tissierellia bacterium]
MNFLGNILGSIMKFIFDLVSGIGTENEIISYYGITIIITTIIFKLILLPISLQQSKSTKKMNELQPKIQELQKKYKNDPQTQQKKLAELYKEHNYNPMSGCLILLIQFPIILAMFSVLREPVQFVFKDPAVYESIKKSFLWIPNLGEPDPYIWGLPLLSGLTTFLQSKLINASAGANAQMESTQNFMNIFITVMIFMAARSFPAGVALYWVVSNIIQVVQQLIIKRSLGKVKEETK